MEHTATERWTVPARLSAVPTTRAWVGRYLTGLRLQRGLIDTAELLVSELVTNAARHALTDAISLTVRVTPDRVVVEVQDDDPLPPSLVAPGPGDIGGRGIGMLGRVAAEWGVTDHGPSGKAVWFALPVTSGEISTEL